MPEEVKQKENKKDKIPEIKMATSEIYVMPEKFRPKKAKKGGKGKIILTIIIIVIVVFLIAGGVVLFTVDFQGGQEVAQPTTSLTEPQPIQPEEPIEEESVEETTVSQPIEGEEPVEEDIEEEQEEPEPAPLPEVTSGLDTDQDNLTDVEEELYSTDPASPDTDNDGYRDGLEVLNLYNPAGTAPVQLVESGAVSVFNNSLFNYQIFYPASWLARAIDETNREIIFSSQTGEFIQVIVEDNPGQLSAPEWYLGQSPGVEESQLSAVENDFFEGVMSPDGLSAYMTVKDGENNYLYTITYNIGMRTEANFKRTFEMMIVSFALQEGF